MPVTMSDLWSLADEDKFDPIGFQFETPEQAAVKMRGQANQAASARSREEFIRRKQPRTPWDELEAEAEWAEIEQRRTGVDPQIAAEAELLRQDPYGQSVTRPNELGAVSTGVLSAGASFAGLGQRMTGQSQAAQNTWVRGEALREAQRRNIEESGMGGPRRWLNETAPGVVQSVVQMAGTPGGKLVNPWARRAAMGTQFGALSGNEAYADAINEGLSPEDAALYATLMGGAEAGIMMAADAIPGLEGTERALANATLKSMTGTTAKEAGKEILKRQGAELAEELVTTGAQQAITAQMIPGRERAASPYDEKGRLSTSSPLGQAFKQTASSVALTGAAFETPQLVARFVGKRSLENYNALPPELQIAGENPNRAARQEAAKQLEQLLQADVENQVPDSDNTISEIPAGSVVPVEPQAGMSVTDTVLPQEEMPNGQEERREGREGLLAPTVETDQTARPMAPELRQDVVPETIADSATDSDAELRALFDALLNDGEGATSQETTSNDDADLNALLDQDVPVRGDEPTEPIEPPVVNEAPVPAADPTPKRYTYTNAKTGAEQEVEFVRETPRGHYVLRKSDGEQITVKPDKLRPVMRSSNEAAPASIEQAAAMTVEEFAKSQGKDPSDRYVQQQYDAIRKRTGNIESQPATAAKQVSQEPEAIVGGNPSTASSGQVVSQDASSSTVLGPQDPRYAELWAKHEGIARNAARKILKNATDAEDIAQSVFMSLWERGGYDPSKSSFGAYIQTAATNKALTALKQRAKQTAVDPETLASTAVSREGGTPETLRYVGKDGKDQVVTFVKTVPAGQGKARVVVETESGSRITVNPDNLRQVEEDIQPAAATQQHAPAVASVAPPLASGGSVVSTENVEPELQNQASETSVREPEQVSETANVAETREPVDEVVGAVAGEQSPETKGQRTTGTPRSQLSNKTILDAMVAVEPRAFSQMALVSFPELRSQISMPKAEFDAAMLQAARDGMLGLHRHDFPGGMTDAEREQLVFDGENYYIGAGLREAWVNSQKPAATGETPSLGQQILERIKGVKLPSGQLAIPGTEETGEAIEAADRESFATSKRMAELEQIGGKEFAEEHRASLRTLVPDIRKRLEADTAIDTEEFKRDIAQDMGDGALNWQLTEYDNALSTYVDEALEAVAKTLPKSGKWSIGQDVFNEYDSMPAKIVGWYVEEGALLPRVRNDGFDKDIELTFEDLRPVDATEKAEEQERIRIANLRDVVDEERYSKDEGKESKWDERVRELIGELSKTMERQVGKELSARRKWIVASSVMQGESPDVKIGLLRRLSEIAPDAIEYASSDPANVGYFLKDEFRQFKKSSPEPVAPAVKPGSVRVESEATPAGPTLESEKMPDESRIERLEQRYHEAVQRQQTARGHLKEANKKKERKNSKAWKQLEDVKENLGKQIEEAGKEQDAIVLDINEAKAKAVLKRPDASEFQKEIVEMKLASIRKDRAMSNANDALGDRDRYDAATGEYNERTAEHDQKFLGLVARVADAMRDKAKYLTNDEISNFAARAVDGLALNDSRTLDNVAADAVKNVVQLRKDDADYRRAANGLTESERDRLLAAVEGDYNAVSEEVRRESETRLKTERETAEREAAEAREATNKKEAQRAIDVAKERRSRKRAAVIEGRVWRALGDKAKAMQWKKKRPIDIEAKSRPYDRIVGEVAGDWAVAEVRKKMPDGGFAKEDDKARKGYDLIYVPTKALLDTYSKQKDAKQVAALLSTIGYDPTKADSFDDETKKDFESAYKAWENDDISQATPGMRKTLEALVSGPDAGIKADLILDSADLFEPGQEALNGPIKTLADGIAEFRYNPVFTVAEVAEAIDKYGVRVHRGGKMLVFKDGKQFAYNPEVLGLEAEELTIGQTVGLNLPEMGIKKPTPAEVVKDVLADEFTLVGENSFRATRIGPGKHTEMNITLLDRDNPESWTVTAISNSDDAQADAARAMKLIDDIPWTFKEQAKKNVEGTTGVSDKSLSDRSDDDGDMDYGTGKDRLRAGTGSAAQGPVPGSVATFAATPETQSGIQLMRRLERDAASSNPKVGTRSIVEFLNRVTHQAMMVSSAQLSRRSPAHFESTPAMTRTKSGTATHWTFHEAGHALSAFLRDADPGFFYGVGKQLKRLTYDPGSYASAKTPEEGFAEFVRRYVRGEPLPGRIVKAIEDRIEKHDPKLLQGLRDAHRAWMFHRSRDLLQQMRANQADVATSERSFGSRAKDVAYSFAMGMFGPRWAKRKLDGMLYSGITKAPSYEMADLFGALGMTLETIDADQAALNSLYRKVQDELKNKPTDLEAAMQARISAGSESDRVMGGVRHGREGMRAKNLGGGLSNLTDEQIDALRVAGFDITDEMRGVAYGDYIYLSDKSVSKIQHEVGKEAWPEFEQYAQYKAALSRYKEKKLDYPNMSEGAEPHVLEKLIPELEAANPLWLDRFKDIQKLMDQSLLMLVMSGEKTVSEVIRIKETYEDFIPLQRQVEDSEFMSSTEGTTRTSGVKRAHGSQLQFRPVTESVEHRVRSAMVAYYEDAMRKSAIVMAKTLGADTRLDYDTRKAFSRLIVPLRLDTKKMVTLTAAEQAEIVAAGMNRSMLIQLGGTVLGMTDKDINAALESMGEVPLSGNDVNLAYPGRPIYRTTAPNAVRVITTFEDGELRYHQVTDPHLFDVFTMTRNVSPMIRNISKLLTSPIGSLKRIATQNLVFAVRNMPRDAVTAAELGTTWESLVPGYLAGVSLLNRLKGDPEGIREMSDSMARGLDRWNYDAHRSDRGKVRAVWDSFVEMMGEGITDQHVGQDLWAIPGVVASTLTKPVDMLNWASGGRWLSSTSEALSREGAAIVAKRSGESKARSELAYQTATINFQQRQVNPAVAEIVRASMFLNAQLQLLSQKMERITDPDPAVRARYWSLRIPSIMTSAALMVAADYMLRLGIFDDDDEWDEMRRNEQERTESEVMSGFAAMGGVLKVPFDNGVSGAAVALAANHVRDWLYDVPKQEGESRARRLVQKAAEFPTPYDVGLPYADTVMQLSQNKSFAGDAIVPQYLIDKYPNAPDLQSFPETAEFFREIGGMVGASPLKVQYATRALFGGDLVQIIRMTDKIMKDETVQVQDIPIIGRLGSRDPVGWSSRSVRSVEALDRVYDEVKSRAEIAIERGDKQEAAALQEKLEELETAHQVMLSSEKAWRAIKKTDGRDEAGRQMTEIARQFVIDKVLNDDRLEILIERASATAEPGKRLSSEAVQKRDEAARILKGMGYTADELVPILTQKTRERMKEKPSRKYDDYMDRLRQYRRKAQALSESTK